MTRSDAAQEIREGLGLPLVDAPGEGVGGKWLGLARQPAVLLKSVHALSIDLQEHGTKITGTGRDPYGTFTIEGSVDGDDVQFRKIYDASNVVRYAGQEKDGEIVGAWRFERVGDFAGVFWLARENRLAEARRAELERKAASLLEGRWRMVLPMAVLVLGLYASFTDIIPQLVAPVVLAGVVGLMLWRKRKLGALVARWEKSASVTSLIVDPAKQR